MEMTAITIITIQSFLLFFLVVKNVYDLKELDYHKKEAEKANDDYYYQCNEFSELKRLIREKGFEVEKNENPKYKLVKKK